MDSTSIMLVTGGGKRKPSGRTAGASATQKTTHRPTASFAHETVIIQHRHMDAVSVVPVEQPLFRPTPPVVEFKEYQPFSAVSTQLSLRNMDSAPRRIKIEPVDSPYFKLSAPHDPAGRPLPDSRIAAGMEACYTITFLAKERAADCTYDLVCVSEREKFIVPVVAVGSRADLAVPATLAFGASTVKHHVTKSFVARNHGDRRAEFAVTTEPPFSVAPPSGFVEAGGSAQITVTFAPPEARAYAADLHFLYGEEQEAAVRLHGTADSADIHLDTSLAILDATYITLSTQTRVVVHNRSDVPVEFGWKGLADEAQEEMERTRLCGELDRMYAMERAALEHREWAPDARPGDVSDDSDGGDDMPAAMRAEVAALDRKFRNLKRQVGADALLFTDGAFAITPSTGTVWPHTDMEFTVAFTPDVAADYACTAFLETTGREARLPLQLRGSGIGPKAVFSYDVLDIGDVFVTSVHTYELELINKGDIDADFSVLVPNTPFGPKFAFQPAAGTLGVGATQKLTVTFCSDILGEFAECFEVVMRGSNERLRVHFKGHVIGPTFHADVTELGFGVVAYEFLNSRDFNLVNTSEVDFQFGLRVPQDGRYLRREFDISPSSGSIPAGGSVPVRVDFVSMTVQEYEVYLAVDVVGVGEGLLSIPITATCVVPEVTLALDRVEFGACFLRYPYKRTLTVSNTSDHPARFEVMPQDEHSAAVASFDVDNRLGAIEPHTSRDIEVSLVCDKLGRVHLPLYLQISGTATPPLLATLEAVGVGPRVVASLGEVVWGRIPCLQDHVRTLELHNDSSIPAPFKTFVKSSRSKFKVDVLEGVLAPGEATTLSLTANLDDTLPHKDELHVLVTEGDNVVVPLKARGGGTTMHCADDISSIAFGHVFTSSTCVRTFLLENKGRRVQTLQWVNATARAAEAEARRKQRKGRGKGKGKGKAGAGSGGDELDLPPAAFTVEPDTVTLKPRTACMFTLRGSSPAAGTLTEVLECHAKVGSEKAVRVIFNCDTSAEFIHPLLQPSSPALNFVYMHADGVPPAPQSQPLALKNVSALPLSFVLRTTAPFSIDAFEFDLEPGEEAAVNVDFDPGYNDDRQSHVAERRLTAVYQNHPRRDHVDLLGDINFPNLSLEFNRVDFGCILNDTTKSMMVKVKNTSKIDCALSWAFVQDEDEAAAAAAAPGRKPFIPVNQVFDILPIRSFLRPGETDVAEFVFYGHANRGFTATAVCEVEGGPEYEVTMVGEASTLGYRLDRQAVEFGDVLYDGSETREFYIHNTSKVAYNFTIRTDLISRPGMVAVSPATGKVFDGGKQRIMVRLKPGVPDKVAEKLVVEVAHFEPVELPVLGRGVHSSIAVSLPRDAAPGWDDKLDAARGALAAAGDPSSPLDVETEASRVVFMEHLLAAAAAAAPPVTDGSAGPSTFEYQELPTGPRARRAAEAAAAARRGSTASAAAAGAGGRRGKRQAPPPFVVASHTCDFSNVVSGQVKWRTFKVTNTGPFPISFDIDKNKAVLAGFIIEPSKVQRLPENASQEFRVEFKATKRRALGPTSVEIPLPVRNGPATLLTFKASITVPDIRVTPDVVDFGTVLLEQEKVVCIQLQNVAPVPTDWDLANIVGPPSKTRDKDAFRLEPPCGVLQPGDKQIVRVVFAPAEPRAHGIKLPIKIASNPKQRLLTCRGRGTGLTLRFDPPDARLGPVLPFADPVSAVVNLVNPTPHDIEVYSLDFDPVYVEEEAVLRRAEGYAADEMLRFPPRVPGEGLPAAVLPVEEGDAGEDAVGELERTADELASALTPRMQGRAVNVVVAGPPGSGVSTQARLLASKWEGDGGGVALITLDQAVQWAVQGGGGNELAAAVAEELAASQAASDEAAAAAAEAAKKVKVKKGQPPPEVPPPPPVVLSVGTLAEVVWQRSRRVDAARALIVDGLATQYAAGLGDAAAAVAAGLDGRRRPKAGSLQVLAVVLEGDALLARYEAVVAAATEALAVPKPEVEAEVEDGEEGKDREEGKDGEDGEEGKHEEGKDGEGGVEEAKEGGEDDAEACDGDTPPAPSPRAILAAWQRDHDAAQAVLERVAGLRVEADGAFALAPSVAGFGDALPDIRAALEVPVVEEPAAEGKEDDDADADAAPAAEEESKDPDGGKEEKEEDGEGVEDVTSGGEEDSDAGETPTVADVDGDDTQDMVFAEVCMTVPELPADGAPDAEELVLPPPVCLQLQRRPFTRPPRRAVTNFTLHRVEEEEDKEEEEAVASPPPTARSTKSKAAAAAEDVAAEPEEPPAPESMRWVIPAKSSVPVRLQFRADAVGQFDSALAFGVVGSSEEYALFARGTCAVPTISSDPRNVFMSRVKNRPDNGFVTKKYVAMRRRYEFGPLLAGKDPSTKDADGVAASNSEVFRVTNNGVFPADVEFSMAGGDVEEGALEEYGGPDDASIFSVQPAKVEALAPGDTAEVRVWAFPPAARTYCNTLVCAVKDNPAPVLFPVTALGSVATVDLHGPWETEGEADEPEAVASPPAKGKKAAKAPSGPPPPKAVINFDRLLVGRTEEKHFQVENTSTVAVAWRLDLSTLEDAPEFTVTTTEGVLEPDTSCQVGVVFTSPEDIVREPVVTLEYCDAEGGFGAGADGPGAAAADGGSRIQSQRLLFKAEAYRILPFAKFPEEEGSTQGAFDFALLRCGQRAAKTFTLENQGKYPITFRVALNRRLAEDLLTLDVTEGTLDPGASQPVTVSIMAPRVVRLKDAKCVLVQIMEATTGEVCESFTVSVTARSAFSVVHLQPMRGINFGALRYGSTRERAIEIRNDGEFDFGFQLVPWGGEADLALQGANAAACRGETDPTAMPPPATGTLAVGGEAFKLTPEGGVVKPGETATVTAVFSAEGAQVAREALRVAVTGYDPREDVSLLRYELIGESCVPGVSAEDWEGIFEEQAVLPELLGGDDGEEGGAAAAAGAAAARVFGVKERTFAFGNIVPSSHPKGVCERFKLTNPNKVQATVSLSVVPSEEADAEVFVAHPASMEIPSHEHRYVDVWFKPAAMRRYQAEFLAAVEGGTDARTKELRFTLVGEGAMPHVTVVQPVTRGPDGALQLDFGRLQPGRATQREVTLRNDGAVPATVTFDASAGDADEAFPCGLRGTSAVLVPGATLAVPVAFEPSMATAEALRAAASGDSKEEEAEVGVLSSALTLSVLHNKYETTRVGLVGRVFTEALAFDNLPGDAQDVLEFGDLDVSDAAGQQLPVTLVNQSDAVLRVEWPTGVETLVAVPSVLHLPPRGTKDVVVTFNADEPVAHDRLPLSVAFERVAGEGVDGSWDNSPSEVSYEEKEVDGEVVSVPVTSAAPEPDFEAVGGAGATTLYVTATAEQVTYDCDAKDLVFKPTMMFQTRVHRFTVNNPTKARLEYHWEVEEPSPLRLPPVSEDPAAVGALVPCPFTISPATGTVPPSGSTTFTVRFAPREVHDFQAVARANIALLSPTVEPLEVRLAGRAQRPVCHFDLPPTDYLERRPAGLPGPTGEVAPLDAGIRVLEFRSLGTRVRNTQRFHIVNPTNTPYEYVWEPVGVPDPAFRCLSTGGVVLGGKRVEAGFEFTPNTTATVEAFYRFSIPSQSISALFLVAGGVSEPRVALSKGAVNFRELLVGAKAVETVALVNTEHIPFAFAFDLSSLPPAEDGKPPLKLVPDEGVVPPNGRIDVAVHFSPADEKAYNYNVTCNVRNKPAPLSLNVKGEGYAVHDHVTMEDDAGDGVGGAVVSLTADGKNYVEFGHVHVNERVVKNIVIANTGKVNFDFSWAFGGPAGGAGGGPVAPRNPMVSVKPEHGKVHKNSSVTCQLEFRPVTSATIDSLPLTCTVAGTRTYGLLVSGRGARPALHFSESEVEFGPVFLTPPGVAPVGDTRVLRITNNEADEDVSLECLYEKRPHLEVGCDAAVLRPGQTVDVPLVFMPRAAGSYSEAVLFEVNGLYTMSVNVVGEGCAANVGLANPAQEDVNFGSLRVGQDAVRRVRIVNRSKRVAAFELADAVKDVTTGMGALEACHIGFTPAAGTLRPRESVVVELQFTPSARVPAFSEGLAIKVAGVTSQLLRVTGACQGMDVKLETDSLTFGQVCVGSRLSKVLTLHNTGDIGTRYEWDTSGFAPDFSVSPAKGFVTAHSEVHFQVAFHPSRVQSDIRYDVALQVEGADTAALSLTGECVEQPEEDIQKIEFEARVRESQTKTLTLPKNDTSTQWVLTPVVQNDMWRAAAPTVTVAPGATGSCDVVYNPVSMTGGGGEAAAGAGGDAVDRPESHSGSVFFALPNGRALLYTLSGRALPPALAGTVAKTTPAKQTLQFTLPVKNWLRSTQRFRVEWEPTHASTSLRGAKSLDVPSLSERAYKMVFYAFKECTASTTVTFTNESTGEYVQFGVEVAVTAAGTVATVPLEAVVRQTVRHTITVDNPLGSEEVTFAPADVSHGALRVTQLGDMTGRPEGSFRVDYRPTVESGGEEATVTLRSDQLGDFHYSFKLKATPAGPEPALRFRADFGGRHALTLRFRHFGAGETYTVTPPDDPSFQVEASVAAPAAEDWEGVDVPVEVVFEPRALAAAKGQLVLRAPSGACYAVPLVGMCVPPKPRGPFGVPAGGSTALPFKNVVGETEFRVTVDNPAFEVPGTLTVATGQSGNLSVKFVGGEGAATTGKVAVTCPALPDIPPWTYYVEGASGGAGGAAAGGKPVKGKKK